MAPLRTAVVVVSGVGDSPRDSATDAVVSGLLKNCPRVFDRGEESVEWYPVPGTDPVPVKRSRLTAAGGAREVDVFELWWADLSRFPGAVRNSLLALLGMLLVAPSIGRAALSGGPPLRRDSAPPTAGRWGGSMPVQAAMMGVVEWITAVPLLLLTAIELALVGAAAFAVWSGATTTATYAGIAGIAPLTAAGVTYFALRYRATRWGAEWVAWGILATAIVLGAWSIKADGGDADRGLADDLLFLAMYPYRLAWMASAAIVLALIVSVFVEPLRRRRLKSVARGRTALSSLVGPFGFAIVGSLLTAAIGAALQKTTMTEFHGDKAPWCLRGIQDWSPQACTFDGATNAYAWGARLFAQFLIPLVYVTATLLVFLLASLVLTELWRITRRIASWIFRLPRTRGPLDVTDLLPRLTTGMAMSVPFCAMFVTFAWIPLDFVPSWDKVAPYTIQVSDWPSTLAASGGVALAVVTSIAGFLRWSPMNALTNAPGNTTFAAVMDRVYDVASFLREPQTKGRDAVVPRFRMLDRFAALIAHIERGAFEKQSYQRLVVFAHSQGTVLATAALDTHPQVPEVALITFGSPLRNLYCDSFPAQFDWVEHLLEAPQRFVKGVDRHWVNFGSSSDFVGRTIFGEPPVGAGPKPDGKVHWNDEPYPHGDRTIGRGFHGAYWSNTYVYEQLASLATERFERRVATARLAVGRRARRSPQPASVPRTRPADP